MSDRVDLGKLLEHCREKMGITEDFPFDEKTLTIRVGGKIFLLTDIDSDPLRVNLKCDPQISIDLRDEFLAVTPGYHMNKVHWNTVIMDGSVPVERILRMIDHSYDLVFKGLKRSIREQLMEH